MQSIEPEIRVKVFISYAHADQELHKKLEEHLSSLLYSGKITIWQDQEIPAGANWEDQITTHLNEADLILLLVSASFIASKYCWNKEVETALERHKAGTVRVIPVILKPTLWQDTPLGQLQVLPTGARPVTQWNDYDAAFEDVARSIRDIVEHLRRILPKGVQRKEMIEERCPQKVELLRLKIVQFQMLRERQFDGGSHDWYRQFDGDFRYETRELEALVRDICDLIPPQTGLLKKLLDLSATASTINRALDRNIPFTDENLLLEGELLDDLCYKCERQLAEMFGPLTTVAKPNS